MPLYLHKQLGEDTFLAVWKISEQQEALAALIGEDLHDAQASGRKEHKHWLASRVLMRYLFTGHRIEVLKDAFNKPSLKIDGEPYHVSITHSFHYAAVIASRTRTVGLDMEKLDERIGRVMHKFMREDELSYLDNADKIAMLTSIWSAKETLYKYYGKKELDFREHLRIGPFLFSENFRLKGHIAKDGAAQSLIVHVEEHDGYVLTYTY
jgi:phosphopantetheinyl transferase